METLFRLLVHILETKNTLLMRRITNQAKVTQEYTKVKVITVKFLASQKIKTTFYHRYSINTVTKSTQKQYIQKNRAQI
jgi:hypothetical protein